MTLTDLKTHWRDTTNMVQQSFDRSQQLRDKNMEAFQEDINKMCKQLSEQGIKEKYFDLNSDFHNAFRNFCLWYTQPDKSETTQYKKPYSSQYTCSSNNTRHMITYEGIKFIFV